MQQKTIDINLLKKAQGGHKESLSVLAQQARENVFVYLFRLTLDEHLAEDLCQETIVQMLKSLSELRLPTAKSFWAWMYKTAFSRVSRQCRKKGKAGLQQYSIADKCTLHQIPARNLSGPQLLIHKELSAAIWEAMESIKLTYRQVLIQRCFQDLSYADIASMNGGTELQARLRFFRAKRILSRELANRGFTKKSHLLPALSIFAALTAGQSKGATATALVNATTLEVSAGTMALGMATTKLGLTTVATAVALLVGTSVIIITPETQRNSRQVSPLQVSLDPSLLESLKSAAFQRPANLDVPKDNKDPLVWADRSKNTPSRPNANPIELLITRPEQDLYAFVFPKDLWVDFLYTRPLVDGPGVDIILAGWSGPPPALSVYHKEQNFSLIYSSEMQDTLGRSLYGYDLSQIAPFPFVRIRLVGTHNQGPHQGFELHEIRARVE